MAGNITWQSGVIQSLMIQKSGAGFQLGSAAAISLSGAELGVLNNTGVSGFGFFAIAEFLPAQSGFGAAIKSLQTIDFYLSPSRDGTNYPSVDVTNASLPPGAFKGSFVSTTSGNGQYRMAIEGIPLLPVKYQGYIINNTGQTIASGWGITIDTYSEAYT